MDKRDDLDKINRDLIATEMRYRTIEIYIASIDRELSVLNWNRSILEENLKILRKNEIAISVNEYKKILQELKTITERTSFLLTGRDGHKRAISKVNDILVVLKKQHSEAFKNLYFPKNNVIKIDFSKKKKD